MSMDEAQADLVAALFGAIDAAKVRALADHEAGICHLSEWSCSFCETEDVR